MKNKLKFKLVLLSLWLRAIFSVSLPKMGRQCNLC